MKQLSFFDNPKAEEKENEILKIIKKALDHVTHDTGIKFVKIESHEDIQNFEWKK